MMFTFAETKPGSGLCKPGTIALFGNVVYSELLNEHLWHFGLPLITRLVSQFFFSSSLIFLLLPALRLLCAICAYLRVSEVQVSKCIHYIAAVKPLT